MTESRSGRGLLDDDTEGQAVLHLQALDDAVAEHVEPGEELHSKKRGLRFNKLVPPGTE